MSNQDRVKALQAGLAAAFHQEQSVIIGNAGHSVLRALGQSVDVPRVALRESKAEGKPLKELVLWGCNAARNFAAITDIETLELL